MPTITNPSRALRRGLPALAALAACCAAATAQRNYYPPPPQVTTAPCVPTKKQPCDVPAADLPPKNPTVEANPFPGEQGSAPASTPAANANPFPGEPPAAAPKIHSDASQSANPFPGEPAPDPASSSSSSSSGSPSSPDTPADPDAPDTPAAASRFKRKHLEKVQDSGHREEEDLTVSKYYASLGNFNAAYLRAKDAVATIPDDPDAHFLLAENALKLKKTDEAIAEYNACLKLDPDDAEARTAKKVLAGLHPSTPQPK